MIIYIYQGYNYNNGEQWGILRKYDGNYNESWEILIDGPQYDAGYSTAYDPVNNLIYLSGQSLGANMNPLGDEYVPNYSDSEGQFFAAYNTDGILQFMHLFANGSTNNVRSVGLEIMEDRLLISGTITGYPDIDVTDDQFYPIQNYPFQNNNSSFVSIYSLDGGLELDGLYFFNEQNEPYKRQTYLNGNNLIITSPAGSENNNLYNYNHEQLVSVTNIPRLNGPNFGGKFSGIISYNIDLDEFPSNTAPIVSNANGKHAFTSVSTNIQLDVSDQDGDALTYTIVNPPSNGTAVITETQGGGVLTYTSNAGFEGTETFSYKANDGTADSNIGEISINVFEKEPNLNWATYYSSTNNYPESSTKDSSGNTYTVGSFYDFSNFKDYTTLNATYSGGGRDGYIAKYNENGELLWSNTFGGLYTDKADDVAIASDGNIIVAASIERVATFSDGEQLGNVSDQFNIYRSVILKLDSSSGEILWKTFTDYLVGDEGEAQNNRLINKSDGSVVAVVNGWNWSSEDTVKIAEINNDTGVVNLLQSHPAIYYPFDIMMDPGDNLYISGYNYNNGEQWGILRKYDGNYNESWEILIDGPQYDAGYSTAYDPVNNLIYLSGQSLGANMNPLGDEYVPNYSDSEGQFFAAYNTDGILQFMHLFANGSTNNVRSVGLEIMEDRLLISGTITGYPDIDVTDDQFYPIQNYPFQNNNSSFVSIYSLDGGLELDGLYFFNEQNEPYKRQTYLNGNNLIITSPAGSENNNLYNYNHEQLVSVTNIPRLNGPNFGGKFSGIISYFTDPNNLNFPPVAIDQEVTTDEDTAVEITLTATDENGDVLTYSIVDQPTNGTVSLVGNIATYTPNDLYDGFDSFTFIVNDGIVDSNIATVSITINNCLVNLSQADPLENCDDNSNGFNIFDLTQANSQIFEGIDISEYAITYHVSIDDAQNDVNQSIIQTVLPILMYTIKKSMQG